jgi:hypothetical protein
MQGSREGEEMKPSKWVNTGEHGGVSEGKSATCLYPGEKGGSRRGKPSKWVKTGEQRGEASLMSKEWEEERGKSQLDE